MLQGVPQVQAPGYTIEQLRLGDSQAMNFDVAEI
jgi:hypothetical protein